VPSQRNLALRSGRAQALSEAGRRHALRGYEQSMSGRAEIVPLLDEDDALSALVHNLGTFERPWRDAWIA
jgi:hypothetical protein